METEYQLHILLENGHLLVSQTYTGDDPGAGARKARSVLARTGGYTDLVDAQGREVTVRTRTISTITVMLVGRDGEGRQ